MPAKKSTPKAPQKGLKPALSAVEPPSGATASGATKPADSAEEAGIHAFADLGTAELTRRVADSVHSLRKAQGLSIEELALRSGVSRGGLSQIETAKTNPTLAVLWRVSAALGVPFSALLGEGKRDRVQVLRRDQQQVLRSADGRIESRPLSPGGTLPGVDVYELRLPPHAISQSEPHAAGTLENLVVLVGSLRLRVEGESFDLGAGDSVCFRADVPHSYENPGRIEARYHNVIVYARSGH